MSTDGASIAAEAFRKVYQQTDKSLQYGFALRDVAREMARAFKYDDASFDTEWFFKACGFTTEAPAL